MTAATSVPDASPADPSPAGSGWTVGLGSIAVFLIALEITIISVALPEIEAAFADSSRATLSWVFTAYNVGVASLMLIAGWLAERFGRKRVFLLGLAIFGAGSIATGLATSATMLIAGRVIQSIGGAALLPASLALILHGVADDKRDSAIGIWGAMAGLAAAVGPTLGALLVNFAGWRWVFLINVPIVAVAIPASRRKLVETRNDAAPRGVDLLAPPLGAAGAGFVVFAIVAAGVRGVTDPAVLVAAFLAIVATVAFVWRTTSHARPLFPPGLASTPSYRVGALGTLFFGAAFAGWLVLAPTFLGEVWGYSVLKAGFGISPAPLAMAIVAGPAGKLSAALGHRRVIAVGSLISALGIGAFVGLVGESPSYLTSFLPGAILLGIGIGIGFPMLTAASTRDVPAHQYAVGAAGNTTVRQVAMALGISIAVAIVGTSETVTDEIASFRASWLVCGACFVLTSAVIALRYPDQTADEPPFVPVMRLVDGAHLDAQRPAGPSSNNPQLHPELQGV